MLQLMIETSGTRPYIEASVDEATLIGNCVASLAEELAYPKRNSAGLPVNYQLRLAESHRPLPHTLRFAEAHILSGAHLILEIAETNGATVPIVTPVIPPTGPVPTLRPRRRSILTFLGWTGVACTSLTMLGGLGAGFASALAPRFRLANRPIHVGVSPSPTATLRGASRHLLFSEHQSTVRSLGWSYDGMLLASGADDTQLLIWSPDGTVQQRIPHPASVATLAWSPESRRLVTGSGNLVTFLTTTGTILARSRRHTAEVSSVAWTANSELMLVVSGSFDTQAMVWEEVYYQPQVIFRGHNEPIEAVSWSGVGLIIASSSAGGAVRVWNAQTAQQIHGFYQDAHVPMRACAFSPNGNMLAVGGDDGMIRLWQDGFLCQRQATNNEGFQCQDIPLRLHASKQAIRALAWSLDGSYLASGSNDGTLTLWKPTQPTPLLTIPMGNTIHSMSWSPDGRQLATASGTSVILWNLSS